MATTQQFKGNYGPGSQTHNMGIGLLSRTRYHGRSTMQHDDWTGSIGKRFLVTGILANKQIRLLTMVEEA